jgi:hypothetical protein
MLEYLNKFTKKKVIKNLDQFYLLSLIILRHSFLKIQKNKIVYFLGHFLFLLEKGILSYNFFLGSKVD